MPTDFLDPVRLVTRANVYFDGRCVSHALTLPDGSRKSVGVVLPATLTFAAEAPEVMECVAGGCDWRPAGSEQWQSIAPGERFEIGANAKFDIRVTEAFHYICHYG